MDEYDPLMFYRITYGDLSPYASSYSKKKEPVRKKVKTKPKKTRRRNLTKTLSARSLAQFKERSCERKKFYATEAFAIKAINEQKDRLLTYYGCNFCGGYHLTTVRNETIIKGNV
jgi:hypothetical protein